MKQNTSLYRAGGGLRVGGFGKQLGGGWVSCVPLCWGLRLSMFSKPSGVGCFFFYIPSHCSLPTISWVITDCNIHSTSSAESVTKGTQALQKYTNTQQEHSKEYCRKLGCQPSAMNRFGSRLTLSLSWPSIQPSWCIYTSGQKYNKIHFWYTIYWNFCII